MNERTTLFETVIAEPVRRERRVRPRSAGRKPGHMIGADIRAAAHHFGRDRYFSLLRRNERKRSYTKTARSRHHFHKYGNPTRDEPVVRPDRVWAADITYLRTEKKFVCLSLITDMYSRRIVDRALSESLSGEGSPDALKKA